MRKQPIVRAERTGLPGTSAVLRPGAKDLQPSEKTYLVEVVGETPNAAPIRVGGSVSYGQVLNELAPIRGLTVGVIGDSFTEGENGVPSYLGVASVMCRELHADVIPSYQTGTGYLSAGQGGRAVFGDGSRIDAVLAGDPDVLFFFGSVNDRARGNGNAVATAAEAVYRKVWSKRRDIPIIVAGIQPTAPPPTFSEATSDINQKMRALVERLNEDYPIAYIDQIGTSLVNASAFVQGKPYSAGDVVYFEGVGYEFRENWSGASLTEAPVRRTSICFTGTGQVGTPKKDGNRDIYLHSDGTHPTWSGSEAYGKALAAEFAVAYRETFFRRPRTEHVEPPAPPAPSPFRDEPHLAAFNAHYWDEDEVVASETRLRKAVSDGADGFVFWVRSTSDDALVLSFGNTLPMAEGTSPNINQTTLEALRGLKTKGGKIATLEEGLKLCKELNVGCIVLNGVKFPQDGSQSWNVRIENNIAGMVKAVFGDDASKYVKFYTGPTDADARTRYAAVVPDAEQVIHYHNDTVVNTPPPAGSIISSANTLNSASVAKLKTYGRPMWYTQIANRQLGEGARSLGVDWKGFTFRVRVALEALPPKQ